MNYRSLNDTIELIKENIYKIPHDIDLIVGIPRSGLLIANYISLIMNKPITTLDLFFKQEFIANGKTKNLSSFKKNISECKKVLVVEDSVSSGSSMIEVKNKLSKIKDVDFIYLAIYVVEEKKDLVDLFFEILPLPRFFEWNIIHHEFLKNACFDIDGVLCVDPTQKENDDGRKYENFISTAKPKFIPSTEIGYIVTSRLEKYRGITEKWLSNNNIKYKKLFMLDSSAEERKKNNLHSVFKAEIYRKITDSVIFIESDKSQAIEINRIAKKPVFCTEDWKMYENCESFSIKKRKIKSKLLKFKIIRKLNNLRKKKK